MHVHSCCTAAVYPDRQCHTMSTVGFANDAGLLEYSSCLSPYQHLNCCYLAEVFAADDTRWHHVHGIVCLQGLQAVLLLPLSSLHLSLSAPSLSFTVSKCRTVNSAQPQPALPVALQNCPSMKRSAHTEGALLVASTECMLLKQ